MPAETHSRRSDLDRSEVEAIVIDRLAEVLGREADDVRPEVRLRDDLDADDFALLDAVDAIEDELGERTIALRLDDDELADLVVVADLIECVAARLGFDPGPDRSGPDRSGPDRSGPDRHEAG